jgi:hypothetical protein
MARNERRVRRIGPSCDSTFTTAFRGAVSRNAPSRSYPERLADRDRSCATLNLCRRRGVPRAPWDSARPEPLSHLVERAAHVVRQRHLAPTVATARRSRTWDLGRIRASPYRAHRAVEGRPPHFAAGATFRSDARPRRAGKAPRAWRPRSFDSTATWEIHRRRERHWHAIW